MKKLLIVLVGIAAAAACLVANLETGVNADTRGRRSTNPVGTVTTAPAMAFVWEAGTSRIERHGLVEVTGSGQGWIPLRMHSGDHLESVDVFVSNDSSGDVTVGVTRRDVSSDALEVPIVTSVQGSASGIPYSRVTLNVGHTTKSGEALSIEILCDTGCTVGGAVWRHRSARVRNVR